MTIRDFSNAGLAAILLGLIAAFVSAIAVGVFVDIFWAADSKPTEQFRGAFLGAFFAFVSVRAGAWLTHIYERAEKNHTALVTIQLRFQEILNQLNDNLYIIAQLPEFRARLRVGPTIYMSRCSSISTLGDQVLPLTNLDLLNEITQLDTDIRKLNDDLATWERSYNFVVEAFSRKNIEPAVYMANTTDAMQKLEDMGTYLRALLEDAKETLSAVRALTGRDRTIMGSMLSVMMRKHFPKDMDALRRKEYDKLHAEAKLIREHGASTRKSAVQRLRNAAQQKNSSG